MRLLRVPEDPPPAVAPPAVVTIGNFDGVHRGHQFLIGTVVEWAAAMGIESAVVTFDPHPRLVLRPGVPLALLSTVNEKAELLDQTGIDSMVVWRFDAATQNSSAEEFFDQLNQYVRVRHLIHGHGFALGRRRHGTPDVLAALGRRLGFGVEEVSPFHLAAGAPGLSGRHNAAVSGSADAPGSDNVPVSSGLVRSLVEAGKIGEATRALARPPTLTGVVVEGAKVGHTIGFPTANLRLEGPLAVPADGVYAAWAELHPYTPRAQKLPAAVSIGSRPTFDGAERAIEAYLLDFAGNLYGQRVRLHFVVRLRGQERFDSIDALVAQMRRDVEATRALLAVDSTAAGDANLIAADG